MLPVFTPFGWMVLALETALAVLLLTGAWVRAAALLGVAQSVAIALSVAYAPHEWPWSYWLMIGAHLAVLLSASGRVLAVDAVRAGLRDGRRLATGWAAVAAVVGLFSVLASFGDPLAARGPGLRSTDLSVSLGEFNLVGGVIVLAVAVVMILGIRQANRTLGLVAAGVAVLAALSLHAQLGFSDPFLGGTPTSAALLFSLAVVAFFTASRGRASSA